MRHQERRNFCIVTILAIVMHLAVVRDTRAQAPTWRHDAVSGNQNKAPAFRTDRILVKLKPGVSQNAFNTVLTTVGVRVLKTLPHTGITILEITESNKSIDQVITSLQASGLVEYAEPDYLQRVDVIPNDPSFNDLWGLHNIGQNGGTVDVDIDAPEAWDLTMGDTGLVVGVIDTGVDYTHPDLATNMWINPGEIAGNGLDDDNNGYVDDVHGIDCINDDSDPFDDNNHGTHVAGTIGARGNNGTGVVGVNWQVHIMALKFLGADGGGFTSDAIECLDYAIMMKTTHGVNIRLTNNSWGGGGFSQALQDAIEASGNAGMLFIAAAGNSSNDNDAVPHYPSSYDLPNIIAVAATDRNDNLASFSSYGATSVDLGAPGVSILSTIPGNAYSSFSGTSMATPHVAGAVALVWAHNPAADTHGVKNLLMNTVDPVAALAGYTVTGGRLNIFNALSCIPGNSNMNILFLAEGFTVPTGQATTVAVALTDCAMAITGATVLVTPSNGDTSFNLRDNGVTPDASANDGIYTGTWNPEHAGDTTLDIEASHNGQTLSGSVHGTVIDIPVYTYDDQIPFAWIDATAGTNTGIAGDDTSVEIPIGFDFLFYGVSHNTVRVSSNGYLTFGTNGFEYTNAPIPSSPQPNDYIAPFWDDLNPGVGGSVYYLLEGTAPNRRLTIEWHDVPHYSSTGTVTFEVTLYEGSNDIVYQYQDVNFGSPSYNHGASATVGIEESSGTIGLQYSYNTATITDQMAIRFFLPQASPLPGYTLVETITVPIDGSSVVSTTPLESGVLYKLRASGTFFIGGPGDRMADAEYADFSNPPSSLLDNCPPPFSDVDLGIGINDAQNDSDKFPFWGEFSQTHVYIIDFEGLGAPISLNYHDCFYGDNTGSLTVEIFQPETLPCQACEITAGLVAQTAQGLPGTAITIPIEVRNAPNAADALGFELTYDPAKLAFTGCDFAGTLLAAWDQKDCNTPSSGIVRVGAFTTGTPIAAGATGNLVRVAFEVLTCIEEEEMALPLQSLVDDVTTWGTCSGCFTCNDTPCDGDVNGDGSITPGDALLDFQCFLGTPECTPEILVRALVHGDITQNGSITPADALCEFRQFLGLPPEQDCLCFIEE